MSTLSITTVVATCATFVVPAGVFDGSFSQCSLLVGKEVGNVRSRHEVTPLSRPCLVPSSAPAGNAGCPHRGNILSLLWVPLPCVLCSSLGGGHKRRPSSSCLEACVCLTCRLGAQLDTSMCLLLSHNFLSRKLSPRLGTKEPCVQVVHQPTLPHPVQFGAKS